MQRNWTKEQRVSQSRSRAGRVKSVTITFIEDHYDDEDGYYE